MGFDHENFPELPKIWTSITVEDACKNISVTDKVPLKVYLRTGKLAVVDQGNALIGGFTDQPEKAVNTELPVIVFGDHTRTIKFIAFSFAAGADGIKVLKPHEFFLPKLFYWFLKAIKLPDKGYARHFQYLRNSRLALPPLNEQRRIADKLDRILVKVEACRERCDLIPLLLKRFRQSVLNTAISGELTENWREDNVSTKNNLDELIRIEPKGDFQNAIESANYFIPDGWVWLTPDLIKAEEKHSLSIGPFGSNLTVKDYRDFGVPLVFVREIRSKSFGDEKTKFVSEEKAHELWAHRVEPGDLLITKMGDPPGDTAVLPLERPVSIITSDCIRIKPNPEIATVKLLSLFIESSLVRSLVQEITAGVAQQKISLKRFRAMPIPIPPLEEQQEIVRRVETLFAYADRLEAQYQKARIHIDRLTPALLDKAFRGELVPQDPKDEPASVLLERIRNERSKAPAHKPKRQSKSPLTSSPSVDPVVMLTRKEIQPSHLSAILKERGPLTAESLWAASQLNIDDFYDQLKDEEAQGLLRETRGEDPNTARLLEVA